MDTAMARLGTHLNASWTLDEVLGVGGMGTVFAATHASGSRAAVKVLHAEFCRNADLRDRFLREGKIAAHVDHPGRVQILGEGVSDRGEPFLVMELLAGTTLGRLLKRADTLPMEQVLPVFDAVLDLLEKCHAAGVVHRDIKPANIFITGAGQVKVLDFGIARLRDPEHQATRVGQTFGTPAFMSPEQAMGLDSVDGRADLWSLGACIYAALAGKRLYRGRTEAEAYLLAATQPAPSLALAAPHLPVEVVAFVDRALTFERARRFQSAAAMRVELHALIAEHAAGRLTPGAVPKPPGVVVRGNDAIEEGEAPLRGAAAEQAHQRLVGIWKALALVMSGARQYGFGHPFVTKGLQAAFDEVTRALVEAPLAVRWDVAASAFTFDDKPVWHPERPPFDRVPYQLFADGIRKIQLKVGLTDLELRDLVAILVSDRSFGGEDSVTALWDRRFEHVAYLAVDSFADGDAEEREVLEGRCGEMARALGRIDDILGEASLEGRAMERNLTSELREAGEAAGLAIDALTRASLDAQLAVPLEQWRERYIDAFVDGYLDAMRHGDVALMTSALTEWTADQIALRDYALAFETQAALRRAFAAHAEVRGAPLPAPIEAIHRAITGAMFPPDALRAVLADLVALAPADPGADGAPPGDAAGAEQQAPPSIHPVVVEGITLALEAISDGALFAAACGCYGAVRSERLRESLLGYIRRFAAGREAEAAEILPRAQLPLGLALIEILADRKAPQALAALETGLASPHLEVRLAALSHLPDGSPRVPGRAPGGGSGERVREEIQRLLEDARPEARLEALRAVGKLGLVVAGPALVRRITAPDFHTLSVDERRPWFETVGRLNPGRAERLAIELLEKRQLIPSEATEQTREIAAQMLFQLGRSHEALNAVKDATRPRWWNTQPVRDAATRAVAAIAARLVAPRMMSHPPSAPTMPPPATVEGRSSSTPPALPASTLRPAAPSRPPTSGSPPSPRRSASATGSLIPDGRLTPLPPGARKP